MPHDRADTSSKVSGDAIYEEVAYRAMSDVLYELDKQALVQMQKLERGLRYLLDNLLDFDLTLEEVAQHAGYSPSYFEDMFREHFEMPFERFVTRLRMRQAARDICEEHLPKGIAKRYGFASSASFSKAFKREIGISPRQFYKGNYAVPDMPLRKKIDGVPIELEYTIERAFALCSPTVPPPRGAETFLMDALALPFTGAYSQFDVSDGQEHVGIWYYRPESGLEYVFGPIEERFDAISVLDTQTSEEDGLLRVVVQGGRYAVFSYPRPEDDCDIPSMQRALSRYILQEWVSINRKVTNTMGFTYERFTADRVYLYLPMQSGMDSTSELRKLVWNVGEWARRIDELIDIDLTVEVLADLEGYSPRNYVDVFSMYYGISPTVYIRRRRLFLAGEEMQADAEGQHCDEILAKYRFASYEQFVAMRDTEFENATDEAAQLSGALMDLESYYEINKEWVTFSVRRLVDFRILGHSIEESSDGRFPSDLTGRVLYWFVHQFPGFEQLAPYFAPDGVKVFIWADHNGEEFGDDGLGDVASPSPVQEAASPSSAQEAVMQTGPQFALQPDSVSRYYVAYILRDDLGPDDQAALDRARAQVSAHAEVVPGGCYAVFSTADDLEQYSLEDAFHLPTRCAFGGWIRDNRWRVDFSRRTFVAWSARKLRFFVPTVG